MCHIDDDVAECERVVEKDHQVVVEGLEKATNEVLFVPTCFFPVVVPYDGNLAQRGNSECFLLRKFAHKEGGVGQGLKICEGRAIPCPGERVRGGVAFASTYAYGEFVLLAIYLRPLETIDGPKATIRTSLQFLVTVVGFGNERHVRSGVNDCAIAVARDRFGIKGVKDSLFGSELNTSETSPRRLTIVSAGLRAVSCHSSGHDQCDYEGYDENVISINT